MEALSWIIALSLAGGLVTLTAILFTLWDLRAELRILNSRKHQPK